MIIYDTGGETFRRRGFRQASLAVDWAGLNPSAAELAKLKASRLRHRRSGPEALPARTTSTSSNLTLLPFYWGFDLGMKISADEMYKMLKVIEQER